MVVYGYVGGTCGWYVLFYFSIYFVGPNTIHLFYTNFRAPFLISLYHSFHFLCKIGPWRRQSPEKGDRVTAEVLS